MATAAVLVPYQSSMPLHELLTRKREEVILRWKELVQGTLAPDSMPPLELVDHMPEFLDEISDALRSDTGRTLDPPPPVQSANAGGHGRQRLRLGFSLDSVVREYGTLRTAIVATARAAKEDITFREMDVVFERLIAGIAHAVSEYSRQRDAELHRQANEHFAFIAHELRNPLSAATMAFHHLRTSGQLPTGVRGVDAVARGLERTSELIDETLQVARIASGIELHRQWVTLSSVFEDAEMGSLAEAESKGIELRVALEKDEPLHLDVRLIRSAVSNLLRNGVKYSREGGLVELRGSISEGRLSIEIEDRCGGLEPGKVEQAFAPFVRLDSRQSGFGLGLAIAKQAAEAHGGSIRVQNLPGKGCIFVLDLPIAEEGSAAC